MSVGIDQREKIMADIGKAYVQIEPTAKGISGKIESELGGIGAKGGTAFGNGFARVLGGTGKAIAGTLALGTAAVGAMGGAFISASGDVASYGDNIDKMSQKMGLSAEAYQEWDAVMQHSGTSMETMKASMKTLASAAQTGNKAFEALGISQEQLATMSQEELFETTIASLQEVEDTTQRTYLAGQLLGRGATELGALLNTSAEDTQAMRDRVRELGGVMSEDAVKAAAAYQDQLQDMQTAFQGLSRNLMAEFLPSLTQVMSGLTDIFSGDTEGGLGKISGAISTLADGLMQSLPQIATVATGIIQTIAQSILENLPTLIPVAVNMIMSFIDFIVQNLPLLIQAAAQMVLQLAMGIAESLPTLIPAVIQTIMTIVEYLIDNIDLLIDAAIAIILGLADGLIEALPKLIERIPEIITKLVAALIENAPKLVEASLKLIIALAGGLIKAIPELIKAIPEIITSLVNGFADAASKMIEVGKNIVQGIWDGITGAWDNLVSNIKSKVDGLVDSVKGALKIGSPSKVFADSVGQWIPAGIAKGIEDGMGVLNGAMADMTMSVTPSAMADVAGFSYSSGSTMPYNSTNSNSELLKVLMDYLPDIASGVQKPINVTQNNRGMFSAVRDENIKFVNATGYHALA